MLSSEDVCGADDIRRYQVYLREERKLDIGTASNYVAALRFFYVKTLKRPSVKEDLPYPHGVKRKRRLPTILSQEEVGRLIDSSKNLFHYAMLLTIYSTGLRRSELCRLKVSNIDTVGRCDLTEKHWAEQEGGQQDSYYSH